jgi:hypothetical protein
MNDYNAVPAARIQGMKIDILRAFAMAWLYPFLAACSTSSPADTAMTYDQHFSFTDVHKIYIEPSSRTDAATITVSDGQIARIAVGLIY